MQEKKPKKQPERRCIGCGQHFEKRTLLRVVRTPDGTVTLDFTGKKSGRGAYLCKSTSCFKKAQKARRIEQNLECTIPEEVYTALLHELQNETE